MLKNFIFILCLLSLLSAGAMAQSVRDDFNRAATTDISGSMKWRKVLDLTDTAATIQINADSTISPFNPDGLYSRGAAYWDSLFAGRFQVGIVLTHKSGSTGVPSFYFEIMDDSSWFTGDGYGFRFQENSGQDRMDIQRIGGSGSDIPNITLLASLNREFDEGDTLFFKFYPDGRKTGVFYGSSGNRDSISVVDTTFNPSSWIVWLQGAVFTDPITMDNFMVGPIPYAITASAGAGGAISPVGVVLVDPGGNRTFTPSADPGFFLSDLLVDTVSVGTPADYTFTGVDADHTIEAVFDTLKYTLTVSAGTGGTITPGGPVVVNYGSSFSFTVTPDADHHTDSILVDGVKVDSLEGYTFTAVTAHHSLAAYFSPDTFVITAVSGPNGSVIPSGAVVVDWGSTQSFIFTPDSGFEPDTVLIDGLPIDSVAGYTFTNITENHSLSVTWKGNPPVTRVYHVHEKWNMVSAPLRSADLRKTVLFPTAPGGAYSFAGGYALFDTLETGRGYWLKFEEDDSVSITGKVFSADTVEFEEGWNMLGSVSEPVSVAAIASIPGGIVTSAFYGYDGSYQVSDTIEPGKGYWVKLSEAGSLIIGAAVGNAPAARIRIRPLEELPPAPPGVGPESVSGLPTTFTVMQNYPNPFNPITTIEFTLPADAYVRVTVYNVLGEEVVRLIDGVESAGRKSVRFDASSLPTGLYTYRVRAGGSSVTRKMLLLR